MGRKKKTRARYLHRVTSRLESPGTPPLKLSDAEEKEPEEAARRKPWMGNLASSSSPTSARTNNAHEERSRGVDRSSDVRGLYKPQDYGISPRRTNGTRQSSGCLPSGAKGFEPFAGWPAQLCLEMRTISALNLQPTLPSAGIKLEIRRKSHQLKRHYLARVDELKAEFPGRWSKDSKLEPLEVNSDSGSVASSDAAHRFLQFASRCDSSENEPLPESDVPTCHSLTLEIHDGDESVGSSSVAEPAIGRCAGAAQDEYACLTESKHAVPSFLTEDPTDSDSDSSDEVPCDADLPNTDDARLAWVTWLKRGA